MAREDTALFAGQNTSQVRDARIAIQIIYSVSSPTLTSHLGIANVPGTEIQGCIRQVSSTTQEVWPDEGRATIGGVRFEILDVVDGPTKLTEELRDQLINGGEGLRDREVRIFVGFDDDFDNYQRVATAYVDGVGYRDGAYKINCRDKTKFLRDSLFQKAKTFASLEILEDDTTITVRDTTGFDLIVHGTSFLDAPSQTVGYFLIRDTGEIVRYTGKTANTFTGCTRGIFRTKPELVEFDVTEPVEDWPEIEEYIYLDLPGPLFAIALMTGVLDVDLGVGGPLLPDSWNLGLSWENDFDQAQWLNIGADLWDKDDLTVGFIVRLIALGEQNGKTLIEKEIYQLLGVYAPASIFGKIGLRRVNKVIGPSGYIWKLDRSNVTSYSDLNYDHGAVRNQFEIQYNYNGTEFRNSVLVIDSDSISAHGLADKAQLSFKGLSSSHHTQRAIRDRLDVLRNRYAEPPMRIAIKVTPDLNWLEIGDIVQLELDQIEDHAAVAGPGISRPFEVQKVAIDWVKGEVSLNLMASGRQVQSQGDSGIGPNLDDTWYTGAGVDISGLAGYVPASGPTPARLTTNLTFAGTADMNSASSIWYHDGDLRIESVITLTGNVQMRIAGFLTVNGSIDGKGGGLPGVADPDTLGGTSTAWSTPGTTGWLGPVRAGDGIWIYGNLFGRDLTRNINGGLTLSFSRQSIIPPLVMETGANPYHLRTLFPRDCRGSSGGSGGQVAAGAVNPPGLGGIVKAKGGDGGNSGAGLVLTCRGITFGVSGFLDLSGDDGLAGQRTSLGAVYDVLDVDGNDLIDFPFEAGGGGGGYPGALYMLMDGDDVPYPSLDSTQVRLNIGATPNTGYNAVDLAGGFFSTSRNHRWQSGFSGRGIDMSPVPYLTGLNQSVLPSANVWNSASIVQYIPAGGDLEEHLVPPPLTLTATQGVGINSLSWSQRSTWERVEIWASETDDRAFADKVGSSTTSGFVHHLPSGGLRYYWIRAYQDGKLSTWFPLAPTGSGIASTAQDSGLDIVMTAQPGRIWNGDASLSPIAWNPTQTYADLHCEVLQFGEVIAHEIARVVLDPNTGYLTYSISLNDPNITVTSTATPSNTILFRFTHDPSGLWADDEMVAVKSGLPGLPGTPGAPGNRVLGVKRNYSSFTTTTFDYLYFHGFDDLGNPADVDATIPYQGIIVTIAKGSVRAHFNAQIEDGWIIFDAGLTAPFSHGGSQQNIACAVKTRAGWKYDAGTSPLTPFTATAAMMVIGTYSKNSIVFLSAHSLGNALGLSSIPYEKAHQVQPGDIQPGSISDIDAFGATLRPVSIKSSLPALPSSSYPIGALVYLTSDLRVYRSEPGNVWAYQVNGADLVAGSIQAAALAATLVIGSVIKTRAALARVELSGLISDPYPFWIGGGVKGVTSPDPGVGAKVWYDRDANKFVVRGTLEASRIKGTASDALLAETVSGLDAELNIRRFGSIIGNGQPGSILDDTYRAVSDAIMFYSPDYGVDADAYRRFQARQQYFTATAVVPVRNAGTTLYPGAHLKFAYRYDGAATWNETGLLFNVQVRVNATRDASIYITAVPRGTAWDTLELRIHAKRATAADLDLATGGNNCGYIEIAVPNTGSTIPPAVTLF